MSAPAHDGALVLHVALDGNGGGQVVQLGTRTTNDPDPFSLVNLGHLIALIREQAQLVTGAEIALVSVGDQQPRRIKLSHHTAGPDPLLADLLRAAPPRQ